MLEEVTLVADDRQTLERLPERFAETWNRHDCTAMGELFAPDADFVNVLGMWWQGQTLIASRHARLHESVFARSVLLFDRVAVRAVAGSAAIVHAHWTMTGHLDATGGWGEKRTGIMLFVMAKESAGWLIAAAQNTEEQAGALKATLE